jgi:hypothetical protein
MHQPRITTTAFFGGQAVGEAIGGSELDEDFGGYYEEGAGTHRDAAENVHCCKS